MINKTQMAQLRLLNSTFTLSVHFYSKYLYPLFRNVFVRQDKETVYIFCRVVNFVIFYNIRLKCLFCLFLFLFSYWGECVYRVVILLKHSQENFTGYTLEVRLDDYLPSRHLWKTNHRFNSKKIIQLHNQAIS